MRLKRLLMIGLLSAACTGVSAAGSVQFALPGYLPDPEPLNFPTSQQLYASLRADPQARIKMTDTKGVLVVALVGDPAQTTFVFFGKGHWAYPSVLRLRRAEIAGIWATRNSFLCGANKRSCNKLETKLYKREVQVVNAHASAFESDEIKRMIQPLPDGVSPPGKDFWITQWGLMPGRGEFSWRIGTTPDASFPASDCRVVSPRYGRPPQYPIEESIRGIGGTADVILTVNGAGRVIDATFYASSRNRNLDRAALDAVSIMRFNMEGCDSPGSLARVRLPIQFTASMEFPFRDMSEFDAAAFGY